MENDRKTQVLRGVQWKTEGRLRFFVGTNGKRTEHTYFAWEPMENQWKTQVLRGNLLKQL